MIDRDDELDPLLADLFAAERGDSAPPAGARDRVKGALVLSVGAGVFGPVGAGLASSSAAAAGGAAAGGGAAGGGTAAGGAVKLAAVTAAGTAGTKVAGVVAATALAVSVGAGGVYVATRDAAPVVDEAKRVVVEQPVKPVSPLREEPIVAPPEEPVAPPVVKPVAPPDVKPTVKPVGKPKTVAPVAPVAPVASVASVVQAAPSVPVTPEERASRLQAERRLLETARGAVARGDGAAALAIVAEHRIQFQDGVLVEEREALAVQALAKAGRMDEARAHLATFKAKWPRSLFLKTLEAATAQP